MSDNMSTLFFRVVCCKFYYTPAKSISYLQTPWKLRAVIFCSRYAKNHGYPSFSYIEALNADSLSFGTWDVLWVSAILTDISTAWQELFSFVLVIPTMLINRFVLCSSREKSENSTTEYWRWNHASGMHRRRRVSWTFDETAFPKKVTVTFSSTAWNSNISS